MKHDCHGVNPTYGTTIVGPTDNGSGHKKPCPPCTEAEALAKKTALKDAAKAKSPVNKPNTFCPRAKSQPSDGLSLNKGGASVDASKCENILQIIITVAGTSDPINADGSASSRAISYSATIDGKEIRYWDRCFVNDLQKMKEENSNIIIFPFHGWTGDNRIKNREIAGAYLIDRLCGEGSQKGNGYYPAYKNRDVHFHFVGHSHGGNVMNEMTKQIAKLGSKWPKKWKVKSLVYLSTPFFNDIHQVKKSGAFHGSLEVFNAYNEYDMTQRLLADFSLEALTGAVQDLDFCELSCYLAKIKSFKYNKDESSKDKDKTFKVDLPWFEDKDDDWLGLDIQLTIPHDQGEKIYNNIINLFENVIGLMDSILTIVDSLDVTYSFDFDKNIRGADGKPLSHKRQLMPEGVSERFYSIISFIKEEINLTLKNLKARKDRYNRTSESYPVSGLIADIRINEIAKTIIAFLDIDSKTLASRSSNGIWHLIYEILNHNIEDFDDTYADPTRQLGGIPVTQLNVTDRDMYHRSKGSKNFQGFVSYIEEIEKRVSGKPSEKDLLDILLTLIGNLTPYSYAGIGFGDALKGLANLWKFNRLKKLDFDPDNFEKRLFELADMVQNYQNIFESRDSGDITDERDFIVNTTEQEGALSVRGGLPYLFVHSHSTSRRCMHKEMINFMKKQTSC